MKSKSELIYAQSESIRSQKSDIKELDESVKYKLDLVKAAEDKLNLVITETNYLDRSKTTLEDQENTLLTHIDSLTITRITLEDEIDALRIAESGLNERILALKLKDESILADKKRQVKLLEAQALELAQIIELRSQEESKTRETLAIWKKTLDKKDENLRIREQKVQMSESKIIQNSNLLNL